MDVAAAMSPDELLFGTCTSEKPRPGQLIALPDRLRRRQTTLDGVVRRPRLP